VQSRCSRRGTLGLVFLLLGAIASGGCGGSGSADSGLAGPEPKNRLEGMQRFKEASLKYDQSAPKNQQSGLSKPSKASKR
jgi:hypothetical protein